MVIVDAVAGIGDIQSKLFDPADIHIKLLGFIAFHHPIAFPENLFITKDIEFDCGFFATFIIYAYSTFYAFTGTMHIDHDLAHGMGAYTSFKAFTVDVQLVVVAAHVHIRR